MLLVILYKWFISQYKIILPKNELPLIGSKLNSLAKSVLITLGLIAITSAKDAAIRKKMLECAATLIIFNETMNDVVKTVKSLEKSGLLIKGVS